MNQETIETKSCVQCSENFDITQNDIEFLTSISPVFQLAWESAIGIGEKNGIADLWDWKIRYLIPAPSLCPDCRQMRRLAWRNERHLYKRKCDKTGKDIISIYSPDKPYKVFANSAWWSDMWSPFDYSMNFDFNKSFFEQFDMLMRAVPKSALNAWNDNINCDYNNYISGSKDCYLNFWIENCENVFYSSETSQAKDSLNLYHSSNVQQSWFLDWSSNVYSSLYVENSNQIANSLFVKWSKDVLNWIFCANVDNKRYAVRNKEVSQDEFNALYNSIKEKMKTYSWLRNLIWEFNEFKKTIPEINLEIYWSENCTWNLINNSHDCEMCFSVVNSDKCRYVYDSFDAHSSSDANFIWNRVNRLYDSINVFWCSNVAFSESIFENSSSIFYSSDCTNNSSDLFGCVWLKSAKYCILNKQYAKEEYEALVPRIIEHMRKHGEWWEFFPMAMSPFWYNETIAMEYYPVDRMDAINRTPTINWSDYENPKPDVAKIIPASKLPENISDIPDDILNWAVECEVTNRPFRIIKQELEFYRKHGLPIPKRHPDQRHLDRMSLRNPRKLFDRKCAKCWIGIKTTYPPDRTEIICCAECFRREMS
ncbi:MAG: hypothetical protein ACD_2C00091G0018 [uncultured bacterium (gcode 4)]|uniref:Uncharacterized protein n=1 Tax=uncultured bacterium (gcode 4) TaxID=1234023 RepID=K2G695_9BACT|nr:MAG: hypothetical protein ACD_2C00091G0018 [uncultured bacterium (gcode 4)]